MLSHLEPSRGHDLGIDGSPAAISAGGHGVGASEVGGGVGGVTGEVGARRGSTHGMGDEKLQVAGDLLEREEEGEMEGE